MKDKMLKKKYGILKRLWLCYKLIEINPILSYCNYCHSYALGKADSKQEDEKTYIGTYWCKSCGATMVLVERWRPHKEGE